MPVARIAFGLWCGMAVLAGSPATSGKAPAPSPARTGDERMPSRAGPDYCADLAAELEGSPSKEAATRSAAAELIREGRAQCAAGNMLSGLRRLHLAKALLDDE